MDGRTQTELSKSHSRLPFTCSDSRSLFRCLVFAPRSAATSQRMRHCGVTHERYNGLARTAQAYNCLRQVIGVWFRLVLRERLVNFRRTPSRTRIHLNSSDV